MAFLFQSSGTFYNHTYLLDKSGQINTFTAEWHVRYRGIPPFWVWKAIFIGLIFLYPHISELNPIYFIQGKLGYPSWTCYYPSIMHQVQVTLLFFLKILIRITMNIILFYTAMHLIPII